MKFSEHGQFTLSVENNILILEGEGYGNKEAVYLYKKQVAPYKQALAATGKPWGNLLHLHGDAILLQDAADLVRCSAKITAQMGLRYVAIVLQAVTFERLVQDVWTKIYQDTGIELAFFTDVPTARDWLETSLYSHEAP